MCHHSLHTHRCSPASRALQHIDLITQAPWHSSSSCLWCDAAIYKSTNQESRDAGQRRQQLVRNLNHLSWEMVFYNEAWLSKQKQLHQESTLQDFSLAWWVKRPTGRQVPPYLPTQQQLRTLGIKPSIRLPAATYQVWMWTQYYKKEELFVVMNIQRINSSLRSSFIMSLFSCHCYRSALLRLCLKVLLITKNYILGII